MCARCTRFAFTLLFTIGPLLAAQDASTGPRVGFMTRHGLAGVVTSVVSGPTIVMEIPENVSITVHTGPSTNIVSQSQPLSIAAIHPGDAILASGDIDEEAHTIQALTITIQRPFAARMLENLHASFGKTWTAGIVTTLEGSAITVKRMDGQSQTFTVDDSTAWRRDDQPASFALIHTGERIRARFRSADSPAQSVNIQGMVRENRSGVQ
jgi:Domain of unknown function (DUF5666)